MYNEICGMLKIFNYSLNHKYTHKYIFFLVSCLYHLVSILSLVSTTLSLLQNPFHRLSDQLIHHGFRIIRGIEGGELTVG